MKNDEMLLIYLHGFNSSATGETAQKLKEVYDDNFLAIDYDYINPDRAFRKINDLLHECFKKNKEPILIGTSLGGFWANYFAEKYDIKCVLINPSLQPSHSLAKYIGENKNWATGKICLFHEKHCLAYSKYEGRVFYNKPVMKSILLGEKDEVIDYKKTMVLLKEHKITIDKNMGHRIGDITKLTSLIDEMVFSYAEEILEEGILLTEHVINLLPNDTTRKLKYVDEVWELLVNAYAKLGGLVGNGFNSKEDMIKNIPFWKLITRHGKIVAVSMYKDKNGRKRVASATDGTIEGKKAFAMMGAEDLSQKRAYVEISGPSLSFTKKQMGENFIKNLIPYDKVSNIINDDIRMPPIDDPEIIKHPELKGYFYQREIGGHWKTKLMLGTPNNPIL